MKFRVLSVSIMAAVIAACGDNAERKLGIASAAPEGPDRQAAVTAPETVRTELYARIDAASLMDADGKAACFISSVNGDAVQDVIDLNSAQSHVVEGWTADRDLNVPTNLEFIVKSAEGVAFAIPADLGKDKSRAAEVFGRPELVRAGYVVQLDARRLPAGSYEVLLKQGFQDRTVLCPVASKRVVIQ